MYIFNINIYIYIYIYIYIIIFIFIGYWELVRSSQHRPRRVCRQGFRHTRSPLLLRRRRASRSMFPTETSTKCWGLGSRYRNFPTAASGQSVPECSRSIMLHLSGSLCAIAVVAVAEQKPEWKHSTNKASASQSSWKRKRKDGKALCEGHGFTAHECSGISCCVFRGGVCRSAVKGECSSEQVCAVSGGQCGGYSWDGPRCCEAGLSCVYDYALYSVCRATNTISPSPWPTTAKIRRATKMPTVFRSAGAAHFLQVMQLEQHRWDPSSAPSAGPTSAPTNFSAPLLNANTTQPNTTLVNLTLSNTTNVTAVFEGSDVDSNISKVNAVWSAARATFNTANNAPKGQTANRSSLFPTFQKLPYWTKLLLVKACLNALVASCCT